MDTDDLRNEVLSCGRRARAAARSLARLNSGTKSSALLAMADQLCASAGTILQANGKDVEKATADQAAAIASGIRLRAYTFDRYKTRKKDGEDAKLRADVEVDRDRRGGHGFSG